MPSVELFGTSSCPYTTEMREWLEWKGKEFAEYDVQTNQVARERMKLLEDGKVVQVGWQGRGCTVNVGAVNASMAGPAQGSTQ